MRSLVSVYLKGIAMGAADSLPGVSGGTIALIVGIYDRLVQSISSLRTDPLRHILSLHKAKSRSAFIAEIREMEVPFLLALGAGIATAFIFAAEILTAAFAHYEVQLYAFFVGLIAASAVLIGKELYWTPQRLLAGGVSIGVVVLISVVTVTAASPALWLVFLSGTVAVSAMVLPGISGALLLIILGQYEYLLGELQAFLQGIRTLAANDVAEHGVVVVTFCIGALIGLFTVAHLVDRALTRDRYMTLAVLVGLMIGGIYTPLSVTITGIDSGGIAIQVLVAAGFGVGTIVAFDWATGDVSYTEAN